jgi:hypothetical protein
MAEDLTEKLLVLKEIKYPIKKIIKMENGNQYIDFYYGTEIAIIGLKRQLESIGVFGIVQNDFNSGNLAGFFGGTADTIRLKIKESDIEKAKPILKEYLGSKE